MKKTILFALLFTHTLAAEFYGGVGFGWNTIDESFNSKLSTNESISGKDRYTTNTSRFAPVVELGYLYPLCNDWGIGISAQWKYLNYKTPNENSSHGQILPNATFSSINIFGPDVKRDFTSKSRLKNEVLLLAYIGKQVLNGYAYLGVGPALITASNSLYVSSVHTPNGTGNHLVSTSVTKHKNLWGGAAQAGYQYCLNYNSFINISYTYLQTGSYRFTNSANAAILNGASTPGPTTLSLSRSLKFTAQEFMVSLNLVF